MAASATSSDLVARLAEATLVHVDARVLALHLTGDRLQAQTDVVLGAIRGGDVRAQTSSLTLYQILAEVYRNGESDLARELATTIQVHPGLAVVAADPEIAIQAAEVRAQLGGRPERALQIATALVGRAEIYLTSRSVLRRIAGMTVLNVEDFAGEAGPAQGAAADLTAATPPRRRRES